MQLSIEIPEKLGFELKTLANSNEFIVYALQKALEENKRKQAFKQAFDVATLNRTHTLK